jgi:hypothetical protein
MKFSPRLIINRIRRRHQIFPLEIRIVYYLQCLILRKYLLVIGYIIRLLPIKQLYRLEPIHRRLQLLF